MSYQLEFRHLRYFLAVAENLHFRKAAEKLFISQPGLSRQIKQMEDDLGVQLFERNTRRVKLTKVGVYLQSEIKRNLQNLDQILSHAQLLEKGIVGDLRFGYVGSAMQNIIPNSLLKFRNENPKALFSLMEMDNQRQIDNILSGDIDIGFVRMERVPKGVHSKTVLTENFCLVLPKNHVISKYNFKALKQLKNESFILFDPNYSASYYEKVMQIFDESGFTPIVTHNTIHATSIFKLVKNNFGISIVPKSLQSENEDGIKFIELKKISQKTALSVIWNQKNRNPMLKEFLKHL
ncbi:LysR substrate-binding domain-containing protein [Hyunsoonleella aestuarii]|uniref:LysR substrate-binding domain-containing protein n=1 Tax=Hyunsoonleella aestuarii TaxID=912802 RepID=A0ABP8EBA4_9FLAO|nr:LysR substrate-binding domain-containing protein [Hyunsoonleella aestuarii]